MLCSAACMADEPHGVLARRRFRARPEQGDEEMLADERSEERCSVHREGRKGPGRPRPFGEVAQPPAIKRQELHATRRRSRRLLPQVMKQKHPPRAVLLPASVDLEEDLLRGVGHARDRSGHAELADDRLAGRLDLRCGTRTGDEEADFPGSEPMAVPQVLDREMDDLPVEAAAQTVIRSEYDGRHPAILFVGLQRCMVTASQHDLETHLDRPVIFAKRCDRLVILPYADGGERFHRVHDRLEILRRRDPFAQALKRIHGRLVLRAVAFHDPSGHG